MRKVYSSAFKAQVVLALLKETKTLSQLATEYSVHPNVLRSWRELALKELPSLFAPRDSLVDVQTAHAQQLEELYAEIGRLTTQMNWLKKSCRLAPRPTASVGQPSGAGTTGDHAGAGAWYQPRQPLLSAGPAVVRGSGHQTSHRRTVHNASGLRLVYTHGTGAGRVWSY